MFFNIQFLRGSREENEAYTGKPGQLTIDLTLHALRVHDGATPGGRVMGMTELDYTQVTDAIADAIQPILDTMVHQNTLGVSVATLDENGHVPLDQLADRVLGQMEYKGRWNANTNTPQLLPTPVQKGDYYVVNTRGQFLDVWYEVGDWIVSNGVGWDILPVGPRDPTGVTSLNGETGDITLGILPDTPDDGTHYVRQYGQWVALADVLDFGELPDPEIP